MADRPILFSGPMVRALLDGRKTQTRRIVKPPKFLDDLGKVEAFHQNASHPEWWSLGVARPLTARGEPFPDDPILPRGHIGSLRCPFGVVGDRLWVRETVHRADPATGWVAAYSADGMGTPIDTWCWKRNVLPAIHMPRGVARLILTVSGVRVERLQDITEADAKAEGPPCHMVTNLYPEDCGCFAVDDEEKFHFARLWDSINGARSPWSSNPWVWVIEFSAQSKF